MGYSDILNESRLYCHIKYQENCLFFSLIDYRNSYFSSDDPEKILEFYNGFDNREQLIMWMRERPKGYSNINEIEGEKDIVVVIPTSDFNGKYAIECRETIFKGLYIIFVESGGKRDFYFNIAHNVNIGIQKAMECKPKWIVIAGDDMINIDPISKLIIELQKIDSKNVDVVYTYASSYHSTPMFLGSPTQFFSLSFMILKFFSKRFSYVQKTYNQMRRFNKQLLFPRYEFDTSLLYKIVNLFYFKKIETFTNILSFGILSSNFIKKCNGKVYDENYINEMEDTDLSIRIKHSMCKTAVIDFKISEYIGSSLGNGGTRTVRVVPGWTYFSYKVEKGEI